MKLIDADALRQAILSTMPERSEVLLIVDSQPEIERIQPKTVNPVKPLDVDDDYTYLCDSCKGELFCGDVLRDHFCPSCGGRIEWKDGDGDG